MKLLKLKKTIKWFTLIELIVVMTILTILGAIGFVTLTGYFAGARDSARLTDMNNIYGQLNLALWMDGDLPLPDDSRAIILSGTTVITYQWYVGKNVLRTIKFEKGGRDPKDDTYYTYTTDRKKKQAQLMGYFEEYDVTKLSKIPNIVPQSHAAALTDYSDRKVGTLGKMIGTLVESGTLVPVQQTSTGDLNIGTTSTGYIVYFDNITTGSGIGADLNAAFLADSVLYNTGGVASGTNPPAPSNSCTMVPSFANLGTLTVGSPTSVNQTWTYSSTPGNCTYDCTGGYSGDNCTTLPPWNPSWWEDCTLVDNSIGADGDTGTCFDSRVYTHVDWAATFDRIYSLLKIGGKWWFNENLAYPLPDVSKYKGTNAWSGTDAGYYTCPGNNNTYTSNCSLVSSLGYMYQWSAAMSGATDTANPPYAQGVCPIGWHIPVKSEISGSSYWSPGDWDCGGTPTGWNIQYAGERWDSISFSPRNVYDNRWTSQYVWTSTIEWGVPWHLQFATFSIGYSCRDQAISQSTGASVRCIKN